MRYLIDMKTKLLGIVLFIQCFVHAQTGGYHTFTMLDQSYNARSLGLGGDFISVIDEDVNMGISNPALLNSKMNKDLSLSSSLLPGGISHGMAGYGFNVDKIGSTMAGYIQYISYGTFKRTAVNGIEEGEFSPFEMVAGATIGKQLNKRLSLGGKLNFLYSQLETYSAVGASVDFAAAFRMEEHGFLTTILAKNIGYQLKTYTDNNRYPLPIDVQWATSYRVKHAPFRVTLLAHHLNKWDITYNDPNAQPTIDALTGDTIPVDRAGWFEKLGRHFSYQLEVFIGKHIDVRVGFDYHRRKEFALTDRPGLAGFSFGAGVHFAKFRLDYGFLAYSTAGYGNMITFSTNLSAWRK